MRNNLIVVTSHFKKSGFKLGMKSIFQFLKKVISFRLSQVVILFAVIIITSLTQCKLMNKSAADEPKNGGLILLEGFEAVVVVDSLPGAARHIAVNSNGDIYVKLRFPTSLGGNAALRDIDHDGKADIIQIFDDYED